MKIVIETESIRIYKGEKEIVGWIMSEWEEDSEVVFSIANAIKLALTKPRELKQTIKQK